MNRPVLAWEFDAPYRSEGGATNSIPYSLASAASAVAASRGSDGGVGGAPQGIMRPLRRGGGKAPNPPPGRGSSEGTPGYPVEDG